MKELKVLNIKRGPLSFYFKASYNILFKSDMLSMHD